MAAWKTLPAADQYIPARRVMTLAKRPSPWAQRAMVVNPIDNADATPVRPPRTDGPADKRINENLAGRTNTGGCTPCHLSGTSITSASPSEISTR